MRAVDANVLVRLIARDDPDQTVRAEAFVSASAWVSILALAEACWVLGTVYELSPAKLASAVEMLLDHHHLVLQEPEVVGQAVRLFRSKPSLGFSDCLLLHMARKAGHLPLGTFDKQLAKVEGAQKLQA